MSDLSGMLNSWAQILLYKATMFSSWKGTLPNTKENKVTPKDQISAAYKKIKIDEDLAL